MGSQFVVSCQCASNLTTSSASVMSGYKTRSDSLMLMRQIKNLKDLGSNLGGDLETSSRTFLSGVQIVRTGNNPQVSYDSDNEEDNEQLQCVEYIQHQQKVLTGADTAILAQTSISGVRSIKEEDAKKNLDDSEARRKAAEEARNRAIEEARRKRHEEERRKQQYEIEETRKKQIEEERKKNL